MVTIPKTAVAIRRELGELGSLLLPRLRLVGLPGRKQRTGNKAHVWAGGHRSVGILFTHAKSSANRRPGGQVYHVLNRSVGKRHFFADDAHFEAFQPVLIKAHQRHPDPHPVLLLSNHWHFAVWPDADGQVTAFCRWLAHTHAMR